MYLGDLYSICTHCAVPHLQLLQAGVQQPLMHTPAVPVRKCASPCLTDPCSDLARFLS